ncbi:MAG: FAD-dependent oxidoreductase [Magnetococcales bacterium]|nr:FAD-dependent oxidoreductase [Magnetococcales bacterium]
MKKNIIIAGSGFAGLWSAISAARAIALSESEDKVSVTVVSPKAHLVIRPRLYEATINGMDPDLTPLFKELGIHHLAGVVKEIQADANKLIVESSDGHTQVMEYDKFILAAGSRLFSPNIPGLDKYAFNVDQIESAQKLEAHIGELANKPDLPARNTVVVVGGGLTGIETASEMPNRLRKAFGEKVSVRVIIVDKASSIAPDMGPAPRPVIEEALMECGVEIITNTSVSSIDQNGITLSSGERIDTLTVVWTGGGRANQLTEQIRGDKDDFGRVYADSYLRAKGEEDIFVTGDVAHVATDNEGNVALMSCQHALSLGRVSGHNAAAELTGLSLHPYSQPKYVTCLDLGTWGAVYTEGWDRKVCLTRDEAKSLKIDITTKWIYPPTPERESVFAVANPDYVIVP